MVSTGMAGEASGGFFILQKLLKPWEGLPDGNDRA